MICGAFTMSEKDELNMMGQMIAFKILHDVRNDEMSINDPIFRQFMPVIFSEGNFDFLKVIAEKWYPDSRKDVIINFLDEVWKMTEEGEKELRSGR